MLGIAAAAAGPTWHKKNRSRAAVAILHARDADYLVRRRYANRDERNQEGKR
jgi:hypothetical protein